MLAVRPTRSKSRKNQPTKLTAAQAKELVVKLQEKLDKFEDTSYCIMCGKHKDRETSFYVNTDPKCQDGGSCTSICRDCARKIALRVDENGEEHEPTKDSVIEALKYLNKPFINNLWNSSIQEAENVLSGKSKSTVWAAYIKNIQMINYVGMTYFDSDFFQENTVYKDSNIDNPSVENRIDSDTYDSFVRNKEDVIKLLDYDPFEKEELSDQPFLYSQLLGLLDASEDANDDMMRTSSAISIVRGFLQSSKIDDIIAKLMTDIGSLKKNSATIKSLQDSKSKITSVITKLAEDSCISLKHSKNAKKGENTWTGKVKKIKDLNLREGEVNGFDLETCKAMRQVMDQSNQSILNTLHLDESEWSDMVAEQRTIIVDLQQELDKYIEISRILLRENLDIKDYLSENNITLDMDLVDLSQLYSGFSGIDTNSTQSSKSEGDANAV